MRSNDYRSLLLCLFLIPALGFGGVVHAQQPERTPIPFEKDPNVPGLSRKQRLERQRELIKFRWEQRKQDKQDRQAEQDKQPSQDKKQTSKDEGGKESKEGAKQESRVKPEITDDETESEDGKERSLTGNRPYATFYMSPSTVIKTVGESFHTNCRILNQDHLSIDNVELRISYPPGAVQPLGIHHDHVLELLEGDPVVEVDSDRGTILYHARFKKPVDSLEATFLTIEWKAIRRGRGLQIRPEIDGSYSRLCLGDICQNQSSLGMDKSNVGAFIHVRLPGEADGEAEKMVESSFAALDPAMTGYIDQRELRPPTLWIDQPVEGELQPDDWLVIDVGLDNPDKMIFDELRLAIEYDPLSVEILDTDSDNTIISGVNIQDGLFRDVWNWDYHIVNKVMPERGIIDYRMGQRELKPQPSGIIARVFVRILQPIDAPALHWTHDAEETLQRPTTNIYLLDQSVYMLKSDEMGATRTDPILLSEPDAYERANPSHYRF